jgi:SH2 domain
MFSWYFGEMSRHQAEQNLMHPINKNGAILIRESKNQPDKYILSVCSQETVSHTSFCKTKIDRGKSFLYQSKEFQ